MKQTLKDRKDVVFYLKMFPLVQIHKDALAQSKAIICEKEKNGDEAALKLLEDAYDHKKLPDASCESDAVDKSMKLGDSLGLRGTPDMVFEDNTMIRGAVSKEKLAEKLDSLKKK